MLPAGLIGVRHLSGGVRAGLLLVVGLTGVVAFPTATRAQWRQRTDFLLEPTVQYGRAVDRVRFRESNERLAVDLGLLFRLGDPAHDTNRIGLTLHGSFGSRDAVFALRPRYTRRLTEQALATFSAGWIFATTQQDNNVEDATLSENGFIGGVQVSHGDIGLGVDVRVLDVGPSLGYEGGTETSILGGIVFLGRPGIVAASFGAAIVLILSAIYVASL
jgi:hypothetical protein